jgi:5'-3' exonuclease
MNFFHRSRQGAQGINSIIYNFFRSLRALIEQLDPSGVTIVLEGKALERRALYDGYKQNRVIDESNVEKIAQMIDFNQQVSLALELLHFLPITVARHAKFECDDAIANVASKLQSSVVVSNDSDFMQLFDFVGTACDVKLYNPMKKIYVESPDYDYVMWKSLRGDMSDNIPGIPGIGDKRAMALVKKGSEQVYDWLRQDASRLEIFERNMELIKFRRWTNDDDWNGFVVTGDSNANYDMLRSLFDDLEFVSITNDRAWKRFVSTFEAAR